VYSNVSWVQKGSEEFNAHDRIMNIVNRVHMYNVHIYGQYVYEVKCNGLGKNTMNAGLKKRARGGFFGRFM
jgi:hypothetical protein